MSDTLSNQVKIVQAGIHNDSGTSNVTGNWVDLQGFDGVMMEVIFGSVSGGGDIIKAQSADDDSGTNSGDLAGTKQTIPTDNNQTYYIDLTNVDRRYVRLDVERDGSSTTILAANYHLYKARNLPVSHGSGVSGEQHDRPLQGTA